MQLAIQIVALLIIVEGLIFLAIPTWLVPVIKFFTKSWRFYLLGTIRIVIAALFLVGADECPHPWVIVILGVIVLLSSLSHFSVSPETMNQMLSWYQQQPTWTIRLISLIALTFGLLALFASVGLS